MEEERKEPESASEIRERNYDFGAFSYTVRNYEQKKVADFDGSFNQVLFSELRRKTFESFVGCNDKRES